jgi:exosortase/archaeosortase family protein
MNRPIRFQSAIQYVAIAVVLSSALYYLPDYFILEKMTADHSAALLNWIGIPAASLVRDGRAFVNEFEIERMCTGIQVTAVFAGILVPFPKISWKRKAIAIGSVLILVYFANIGRIALEVFLLYKGILPWYLAHYPTGLILGVFSVAFLVLVLDLFIPEIGDYAVRVMESFVPRRGSQTTPS